MNHDECVALVIEQGVKQDQIQTDEWDGLPYFTPDNPMYPEVRVLLLEGQDIDMAFVGKVGEQIRRKCGHNAADWFRRTASEFKSDDELLTFVRSTVRVS